MRKYPIAYVKRKGKLVLVKAPKETSSCYFCSKTILVEDIREKNFCPDCRDLVMVLWYDYQRIKIHSLAMPLLLWNMVETWIDGQTPVVPKLQTWVAC